MLIGPIDTILRRAGVARGFRALAMLLGLFQGEPALTDFLSMHIYIGKESDDLVGAHSTFSLQAFILSSKKCHESTKSISSAVTNIAPPQNSPTLGLDEVAAHEMWKQSSGRLATNSSWTRLATCHGSPDSSV